MTTSHAFAVADSYRSPSVDAAPGKEPWNPRATTRIFVLIAHHRPDSCRHYFWGVDPAALRKLRGHPRYSDYDSEIIELLAPGAPVEHGYEFAAEAV